MSDIQNEELAKELTKRVLCDLNYWAGWRIKFINMHISDQELLVEIENIKKPDIELIDYWLSVYFNKNACKCGSKNIHVDGNILEPSSWENIKESNGAVTLKLKSKIIKSLHCRRKSC